MRVPLPIAPSSFFDDEDGRAVAARRPRRRAECADVPRPCPFVGCRHHLYLEVSPTGQISINNPHVDLFDMTDSCALDLAERGGMHLTAIGQLIGRTRERVRQIEAAALMQLRRSELHQRGRGG